MENLVAEFAVCATDITVHALTQYHIIQITFSSLTKLL